MLFYHIKRQCQSDHIVYALKKHKNHNQYLAHPLAYAARLARHLLIQGLDAGCAILVISFTGLIVPNTFDTCVTATSLVRDENNFL